MTGQIDAVNIVGAQYQVRGFMKLLYASLAIAIIALSGCTATEIQRFFGNSEDRNGSTWRECQRTPQGSGYVVNCAPHSADRNDESGRGSAAASASTAFSDLRLKRDLVRVGTLTNGIPLYAFNYIWGGPRYIGVVAQDVLKVMPAAVTVDEYGFYRVDYSMVGARMVLVEDQPQTLLANSSAIREQRGVASRRIAEASSSPR